MEAVIKFINFELNIAYQYCRVNLMKEHKHKQQSPNKQGRCNPREYLRFTFYKPNRISYKSSVRDEDVQLMRMTQIMLKPGRKQLSYSKSPAKQGKQSIKRRKSKQSTYKNHMSHIEKSPYLSLSNQTQVQKMLKFLIPVNGPNQSVREQIKRHNYLNFRNAQLLIVKKSQNFEQRMKAYSNRMGLPQNSKIYTMNSKDKHIKDALNRRGWIESSQQESVLFHLKWVYKDNLNDYNYLQQGQFYNHFKNNQELTNKNNLRKNIKNTPIVDRPSFPLSYDIDSNDDNNAFHQNFMKIQAYKLLDRMVKFISSKNSLLYQKTISNPLYYGNYNKTGGKKKRKSIQILYKSQLQFLQMSKSWLKLQLLLQFFTYITSAIQQEKNIVYAIFRRSKQMNFSLKQLRLIEGQFQYGAEQLFSHFSSFYLVQVIKMWKHLKPFLESYGQQNMWILKPTGVSRGSGITITNDLTKIIQLRYGKIVQKYIENPLLLECGRKFDLRQWVLVTSFEPLNVYVFDRCYVRFSSQKYSKDNYQNLQKHLTNYSQNKQSYLRQKLLIKDNLFRNSSQLSSVMSQEDLSARIGPKWPQIKSLFYLDILKTLKCCKREIVDHKSCFEVYGFDIILDQNYKPFILEVNLSPACEERQFLRSYLQEMADGLVEMIEGGQPIGWIKLHQQQLSRKVSSKQKLQKVLTIQRWWRKHKMSKLTY